MCIVVRDIKIQVQYFHRKYIILLKEKYETYMFVNYKIMHFYSFMKYASH